MVVDRGFHPKQTVAYPHVETWTGPVSENISRGGYQPARESAINMQLPQLETFLQRCGFRESTITASLRGYIPMSFGTCNKQ
jgi:hypothetical protein